jgi:hypothetical protein
LATPTTNRIERKDLSVGEKSAFPFSEILRFAAAPGV